MTNPSSRLPPGFEKLEPFVAAWAAPTTHQRALLRSAATERERRAFYDAAKDLLQPALSHLDARPLEAFDASERNLMNLMLSLAHVALAVEVQQDAEAFHSQTRDLMRVTRSAAD